MDPYKLWVGIVLGRMTPPSNFVSVLVKCGAVGTLIHKEWVLTFYTVHNYKALGNAAQTHQNLFHQYICHIMPTDMCAS